MPGQLLTDEPADGILRLTIANPTKRNALDHAILEGIAAAVDAAHGHARCIVLTGADAMFSSGYDIGDIPADVFAQEAEKLVAHPFTGALEALDATDVPTVAALTGHTIGGGLELALACDLRVTHDGVRFGMPPAKLGLVYSHTGLRRFVDAIGLPHTRELFLLGRNIPAAKAVLWGLVNEVVAEEKLEATALEWATELAANAPLSVAGNKQVLRALMREQAQIPRTLERELIDLRKACFASDDMREGVRAFAEKRPAQWTGR